MVVKKEQKPFWDISTNTAYAHFMFVYDPQFHWGSKEKSFLSPCWVIFLTAQSCCFFCTYL